MNTELSTRNRGPRQAPASRPRKRPAAGQPAAGQPAAGQAVPGRPAGWQPARWQPAADAGLADEPGTVQTAVRVSGGQATTRPAGRPAPRLRPPGAGQRPAAGPVPAPAVSPRPAAAPAPDGSLAAIASHVPRTRFILLVLGMLSGGLVCLLVINTTLAAASFRINSLQQGNVALAQQEQTLRQQVTAEESPSSLYQRALKLGMRPQQHMNFLNLRTGRVHRAPATLPGIPNVPGYAP